MAKGKVKIDIQHKRIIGQPYHYVYTFVSGTVKEQKRFLLWGNAKKYASKTAKRYRDKGYTVEQKVFQ